MKGYLIDKNGALTLLPEFLSWDVCHGMGEPCDWFEVSFIYYSAQLPKLQSACRFRAVHNNGVVFKGIIDEYSISIDEKGSVVTLSGDRTRRCCWITSFLRRNMLSSATRRP